MSRRQSRTVPQAVSSRGSQLQLVPWAGTPLKISCPLCSEKKPIINTAREKLILCCDLYIMNTITHSEQKKKKIQ